MTMKIFRNISDRKGLLENEREAERRRTEAQERKTEKAGEPEPPETKEKKKGAPEKDNLETKVPKKAKKKV